MTMLGLLLTLNLMVGLIMIHLWNTRNYEKRLEDLLIDIKENTSQ